MGRTFRERISTLVGRTGRSTHPPSAEEARIDTEAATEALPRGGGGPSDRARLPDSIGGYEVLGEIGRGGMGVVVKARQPALGRVVAVKIIREELLASPTARARFRVEAEAAGSLRHPNIVTLHEAGETDGLAFFSMELVEGESLDRVLAREGPFEPRRAARLVADVADAVQHAHERDVLHRDLKPGNVLIDADGRPKVVDFGIALRAGERSAAARRAPVGTPAYMAPEQAAGREADVAAPTDVYGIGAMLYELLTGRPPRRAGSMGALLLEILDRDVEPPRRLRRAVPRELEAICLRCLARAPEDRYQTASALAADLRAFLAGEPVGAAPRGVPARVLAWLVRRPALSLTYAALALFYANHALLYALDPLSDGAFLRVVTLIAAAWGVGATVMQLLLEWTGRLTFVRYAWATMDVALLTLLLLVANGPKSPLVAVYLLVILSTGFRWRPWLTVYVTAASIAAFVLLLNEARVARPHLVPPLDDVLVTIVTMIVVGLVSAALIRTLRRLAGLDEPR